MLSAAYARLFLALGIKDTAFRVYLERGVNFPVWEIQADSLGDDFGLGQGWHLLSAGTGNVVQNSDNRDFGESCQRRS